MPRQVHVARVGRNDIAVVEGSWNETHVEDTGKVKKTDREIGGSIRPVVYLYLSLSLTLAADS